MTCYMNSNKCWGTEWPVLNSGKLVTACSGHKDGSYRKPVVRVEVIDYDIVESHKDIKRYLVPFIDQELGDIPIDIYGTPGPGGVAADVFVATHAQATRCEEKEPTHLFVVWDMVHHESDDVFQYIDKMLDNGVVIESLTL